MTLVTTRRSLFRSYKNIFTTVLHEYESTDGVKSQHSVSDMFQNEMKIMRCKSVTANVKM